MRMLYLVLTYIPVVLRKIAAYIAIYFELLWTTRGVFLDPRKYETAHLHHSLGMTGIGPLYSEAKLCGLHRGIQPLWPGTKDELSL